MKPSVKEIRLEFDLSDPPGHNERWLVRDGLVLSGERMMIAVYDG